MFVPGDTIKDYFLNFFALNNDISIDLSTGQTVFHNGNQPNWRVHLVDTGFQTQTGGRLKRLRSWLGEDDTFMFTYGDGVADPRNRRRKYSCVHQKLKWTRSSSAECA